MRSLQRTSVSVRLTIMWYVIIIKIFPHKLFSNCDTQYFTEVTLGDLVRSFSLALLRR